jgi:hypothetical protein
LLGADFGAGVSLSVNLVAQGTPGGGAKLERRLDRIVSCDPVAWPDADAA